MMTRMTSEGSSEERVVPMRLQRFLARAGVASRRGSENLMCAGRVQVNGVVVTELGSKVDPSYDVVTVDGKVCRLEDEHCYLVLDKPAGFVTTMRDPQGRPCVADLVPTERYPGLFAVGRLDRDTTGALLFTTDGDAAQGLLHPSHHVRKHYLALVEGVVQDHELEVLRQGIELDDGRCQPAEAEVLPAHDPRASLVAGSWPSGSSVVGLGIHEGRKHQVKRMLSAIGHPVISLHRDAFGPIGVPGMQEGTWRLLNEDEQRVLLAAARGEVVS
jgi:23S rRNA pseudouridine2605 synthase